MTLNLSQLSYYRLSLYLTALAASAEFVLLIYLMSSDNSDVASKAIIRVSVPLAILFGLWALSNIARYLGAIWFLVSAASVLWPLFTNEPIVFIPGLIWGLVVAVVSLVTFWILVFSKQFGNEFAERQDVQPRYKKALRKTAIVVIVVSAIAATANDIYQSALSRTWRIMLSLIRSTAL